MIRHALEPLVNWRSMAYLTGSTWRSRVGATLLFTTALLSSQAVAPTAAEAATTCSGTRIATYPIATSSTNKIAELRIFYNSSTGYNCAMTVHTGVTVGRYLLTHVYIASCRETTPGGDSCRAISQREDEGVYASYAGPVSVYGRGRCIVAFGFIKYTNGVTYTAGSHPWPGFCG